MHRLALFTFVALGTACSPAPMVCSPGASVACTGLGGCAGGQVCNAAGTGFEACGCAGSDAGNPVDAALSADTGVALDTGGAAQDAAVASTMGAIRVHWTLMRGGTTLACSDVAGLDHISVVTTGASGGTDDPFPCADGVGTTAALAFASYDFVVDAVDSAGASLGSAPVQPIVLAASPCDAQVGTTCVRDANVVVQIF